MRTAALFETTTRPDDGNITVQLLAQLRSTGRILDSYKLVLGGTRICVASIDLGMKKEEVCLLVSLGYVC